MQLHTYLNFDGSCRDAFQFYHERLGGEILQMMTWKESPMADQAPSGAEDRIMYACLRIDGQMLMGSDSTPQSPYQGIKDAGVVITVDEPGKAEQVFEALSENAEIQMPMGETFWAQRFGMLVDRFGVPWMVNCAKEGW